MKTLATLVAMMFAVGCSSSPTAPTNARIALSIAKADLPVSGTTTVTATVQSSGGAPLNGVLVTFSGSLGTLTPSEAYTANGVATATYTATSAGVGAISALSGSATSERVQVRIGDLPTLPEINNTPAPPTVSVSCNNVGTAGLPTICAIDAARTTTIAINWGDGSAEQAINIAGASAAHTFARAGSYTVLIRGVDGLGRVATASATATVVNPPPPPPEVTPQPAVTSVGLSQEAPIGTGVGGCAIFTANASAASGTTLRLFFIDAPSGRINIQPPGERVWICGLAVGNVVTAKVTDTNNVSASYPIIVK